MNACPLCARLAALLLAAALAAPGGAAAHTRSASYSSWKVDDDGARVRLRIALLELTRLPPELLDEHKPDPAGRYLRSHLQLSSAGGVCEGPEQPTPLRAAEGWLRYEWRVRCPPGAALVIDSRILHEVAPSHLHFARLRAADGRVSERVLTSGEPRWELTAGVDATGEAAAGTSLAGYLALGIGHIVTGWDHLAFVLALLLLAGTLGEVAALVTSFTIAHSVTLGLAVLGIVHPDAGAVEALIGFSIALVAAENVWLASGRGPLLPLLVTTALGGLTVLAARGIGAVPATALAGIALFSACHFGLLARAERPARLRAAVAFGFGLVHGFGFAGVLAEMELPTERVAAALFGFNAGVELGQLAVVIAVWPLLRAFGRWRGGRAYWLVAEAGSAAICGLGLFWFATRTFG